MNDREKATAALHQVGDVLNVTGLLLELGDDADAERYLEAVRRALSSAAPTWGVLAQQIEAEVSPILAELQQLQASQDAERQERVLN